MTRLPKSLRPERTAEVHTRNDVSIPTESRYKIIRMRPVAFSEAFVSVAFSRQYARGAARR